ncbi:MAG: hypothetical protein U1E31_00310 [Rickettsiales bacterium]
MQKKIIANLFILGILIYLVSYVSWHVFYGTKNITTETELKKQYSNKLIAFKKFKIQELELTNKINYLNNKKSSDLLEEHIKKLVLYQNKKLVFQLKILIKKINT